MKRQLRRHGNLHTAEHFRKERNMAGLQRTEWMGSQDTLPSRYWEPQPDEEDLERMRNEYEQARLQFEAEEDEELPFV